MDMPAWSPCAHCENYWCNLHGMHAYECPCPPVEEWEERPYASPNRRLNDANQDSSKASFPHH